MQYMRIRKWTERQLKDAVRTSTSYREVIFKLGLVPAGGNYAQVQRYVSDSKLSTNHFTGKGWSKGKHFGPRPFRAMKDILLRGSTFQSFKLKRRLFQENLKLPKCELCGWRERSADGRLPLELDHINGDPGDNRISNLRILCPNCHSLQPTHRGLNINRRH